MAELYLIRHAQASFGTEDYDRLSKLGLRQAEVLGNHLRDCGIHFDSAYSGDLKRQSNTAEIALQRQAQNPGCEVDTRFNEIETGGILDKLVPLLKVGSPQLEALAKSGERSSKDFQKALEIVFQHWVTTDQTYPGLQSWADYSGTVYRALGEIVEREGSGKTVAIFTSGGTIATIVAHVLGVGSEVVYKFYEPLYNCSITRLLYSRAKVSLSCYNDHQFIRLRGAQLGEELLTYR